MRLRRQGVAAVELAVLLPVLAFLFVIAVDWSRIFYYSLTITNCARNGAFYVSDPYATTLSPYDSLKAAALADAPNLSPQPDVTAASGTDTNGSYVDCTVSYPFQTLTNFPGVPQLNTLTRTVRVYQAPKIPN
jgi:Flp pilus assembly protein TadG